MKMLKMKWRPSGPAGKTETIYCQTLFFPFMRRVIAGLEAQDRLRTAENYRTALNSFLRFRGGEDLPLREMDCELMRRYELYLTGQGIVKNTVSFYMRILRAVYNRAVEKKLTEQRNPFRHVYTGIDKTAKRAIPFAAIKRIKALDLSRQPALDFARDMFLFSFYTRGMSFVDMAYLQKRDLKHGILTYHRRKTGQPLAVRWEQCMQEIVEKYGTEPENPYLLPILRWPSDRPENRYRSAQQQINKSLKEIARMAGVGIPLTMYVARHSWASTAKSMNIPVSVISEGMGHESEATTRIYLASLDTAIVDRANRLILKGL